MTVHSSNTYLFSRCTERGSFALETVPGELKLMTRCHTVKYFACVKHARAQSF